MNQPPTPDNHWPILQPGPARYELLATPAGPVLATAHATVTGWRIHTNGPIRRASTRQQALAILASLAGTLECQHCDTPIRWHWRPGRFGGWAHQAIPPEGPHVPWPADLSWQEVPCNR